MFQLVQSLFFTYFFAHFTVLYFFPCLFTGCFCLHFPVSRFMLQLVHFFFSTHLFTYRTVFYPFSLCFAGCFYLCLPVAGSMSQSFCFLSVTNFLTFCTSLYLFSCFIAGCFCLGFPLSRSVIMTFQNIIHHAQVSGLAHYSDFHYFYICHIQIYFHRFRGPAYSILFKRKLVIQINLYVHITVGS